MSNTVSRRELNAVVRLLRSLPAQLSNPPASRRRNGNRRRRRTQTKKAGSGLPPVGQPGMPLAPAPRRQPSRLVGNEGHMRVSRDELLTVVTAGSSGDASLTILADPVRSKDDFPWLSGIASSWERVVWHKLELSWRSAVGTTTDGMVAYGLDWNSPSSSKTSPKREEIVALTPVHDHPIWQSTDGRPLVGPANMLRSRNQYIMGSTDSNDAAPCSIMVNVSGGPANKKVGELWVRYDLTMSGPRKASS